MYQIWGIGYCDAASRKGEKKNNRAPKGSTQTKSEKEKGNGKSDYRPEEYEEIRPKG